MTNLLISATDLRSIVEQGANALDGLEGINAVSWYETGRRTARLEAYPIDEAAAQAAVGVLALQVPELKVSITPFDDEDWVKMSLEGLPPVRAGSFFVCGSHDLPRRRTGKRVVRIEAAEAFGTGHHGTTKGCLLELDRMAKSGTRPKRVLDVGTGSGVLALGAARLGAFALGTEIDARAAAVAVTHVKQNGLRGRVQIVVADGMKRVDLRAQKPFDLVFANILMKPLIRLAPDLVARMAPAGKLVLSGLLQHQEPAVRRAYESRGLVMVSRTRLEGWATLVLRRP